MRYFVFLHQLWVPITIGVIRGVRQSWPNIEKLWNEYVDSEDDEDVDEEAVEEEVKKGENGDE